MWTAENRACYERPGLRYPTDLTDDEWALVAPHIRPAKRGGRPRTTDVREVVNAVLHLLGTGCQWRALPTGFPPRTTVFEYLDLWDWDGTLERIHHALYVQCREQAGKEASPTAVVLDSRSVRSAEKGGPALIQSAATRARGSKARSATSSWTRLACW